MFCTDRTFLRLHSENNARGKRSGTLNAATVRLDSHGCPKNLVDGEQPFRAKVAAGQSASSCALHKAALVMAQ